MTPGAIYAYRCFHPWQLRVLGYDPSTHPHKINDKTMRAL